MFDAMQELDRRISSVDDVMKEENAGLVVLAVVQQLQRLANAQEIANEHIANVSENIRRTS